MYKYVYIYIYIYIYIYLNQFVIRNVDSYCMYPVSVEAENVGISAEPRILSLKRFCSSSPFFFAARLRHPAYPVFP